MSSANFFYIGNSVLNSALFTSNLLLPFFSSVSCVSYEYLVVLLPPFNLWNSVKPLEGVGIVQYFLYIYALDTQNVEPRIEVSTIVVLLKREVVSVSVLTFSGKCLLISWYRYQTFGTDADTNFRE